MKAIVQNGYGSPDLLELRDIPVPVAGDEQILVRVRAASVNAADWHLLGRLPHVIARMLGQPRTEVPGRDMAGIVEAVGPSVARFRPGDEVFGVALGSFAEYALTNEDRIAAKPSNLTFEQAAAIPIAGITALQGMRDHARVRPGQKVLVYGAGGGVGSFAVQIAKALGARVTAVTNASNLETLRGVGADAVIDYAQDDFTRSGERYDVIFDVGANRPLLECKRVLTENGSIVIAGAPPGLASIVARMMSTQALARLGRVRAASFMARIRHDDLLSLKDLAESGKLTPVIDREGLLCDVPEAIAYVGSRRARGKVVIRVR